MGAIISFSSVPARKRDVDRDPIPTQKKLENNRGSILLELTATLPLFLTLLFLGAEYAKLNDEVQRVTYLTRELLSIGVKTCGNRNSIADIIDCVGNDTNQVQEPDQIDEWGVIIPGEIPKLTLERRIEAAIAEQMPDTPVYLLLHSVGYINLQDSQPNDWRGRNQSSINYFCIVPFGKCVWDGAASTHAELDAAQVPVGWLKGHAPSGRFGPIQQSKVNGWNENVRNIVYNRCETYIDPNVNPITNTRACVDGGGGGGPRLAGVNTTGSCCGILAGELWVPYTPLTPVGDFVEALANAFGDTNRNDNISSPLVSGQGAPVMQRRHQIYFGLIL